MRYRYLILAGLVAAHWPCAPGTPAVFAQFLPEPSTTIITPPVLPTGISEEDVELFGRYCYVWQQRPGAQVVQYEGQFALHMGQRRVHASEAVVWIERDYYQGRPYAAMQIFLWRDAVVLEPGGTVTRGDVLFATLNTFGKVRVNCSATATQPGQMSPRYQQASKVREAWLESRGAAEPGAPLAGGLTVLRTREPGAVRVQRPHRQVFYRATNIESELIDEQRVVLATGDVYVAQGQMGAGDFLEIRADAAVLWLRGERLEETLGGALAAPARAARPEAPSTRPAAPAPGPRPVEPLGEAAGVVAAAYLEGDVVMTLGERMVRARRIYYDFETDQAYILDAVVRVMEPQRGVPFYVRAAEVRQLARDRYVADKAKVSTDEFYTPHYAIGADRVVVVDRTPRDAAGQIMGVTAGTFAAKDVTFNVENSPLFWWPYARGDVRQGDVALRRFRMFYSDQFGVATQTRWNLFNVLGTVPPEGFDATLRLDYFARRGPGAGLDMDYQRERSFGGVRGYYIYDTGEDDFGRLRQDIEPDDENRGRFTWRHRQYLPDGWEATLELSYLSDPTFLEKYFPDEFYNGKDQETLLYLKKQRDNWAFTALANWRINDFLTQTEHLPEAAFYLLGEPILDSPAVLFSEARAGLVRYRPDSRRILNSERINDNTEATDVTVRADTRQEADVPVDLGPFRLVPFGVVRGSYWDGSANVGSEGNLGRGLASGGFRSSAYSWRVYEDVQSRLLDLYRLRHVIKPDATVWWSEANYNEKDLTPFDEGVETINDFDGFTVGLRQLFQTQRGGPGLWRSVDWVTIDLEWGMFDDVPERFLTHGETFHLRPEESIARDFVNLNSSWRLGDNTVLLYDANYDIDRGNVDVQNLSLAVERDPRLACFLGWRNIAPTDSNLFGFGANYKATEVHTFAFREYWDIQRDKFSELSLTYIRKLPRWYVATTFELDDVQDDFGISISAWPEGIPEAALGTRRYTGLAESAGALR